MTEAALTYLPARSGEDVASAAYEVLTLLTQLGFTDLLTSHPSAAEDGRMTPYISGYPRISTHRRKARGRSTKVCKESILCQRHQQAKIRFSNKNREAFSCAVGLSAL